MLPSGPIDLEGPVNRTPASTPVLGYEPDDLVFRSGDLFPLSTRFGDVAQGGDLPVNFRPVPYGLRHAVPVRPEDPGMAVDARALTLCPERQIALLDGEPLSVHAARTNGKTRIPYDTDTAHKKKPDYEPDVRDD